MATSPPAAAAPAPPPAASPATTQPAGRFVVLCVCLLRRHCICAACEVDPSAGLRRGLALARRVN